MAKMTSLVLMALLVGFAPFAVGAEAEFAAIDGHARSAPQAATGSIDSLAAYLVAPARDDRAKARALFTWIALNINYDVSCFGEPPEPAAVLKTRRAVCAGYAALFKALADAAGLEAMVIHGHAKGVGPKAAIGPDGLLTHDWNAVKIDGQWALVDCTWGAGRLDEHGRFRRRFCDHYFLTPAELFIYDHLPSDDRWQLLHAPVSRQQFAARVWVQPAFFEHGLRLVSHESRLIEADNSLAVTIHAPRDTLIVASLSQSGWDLDENHTFSQREADQFVIRAMFPSPGDYVLRVFSRKRDAPTQDYESALEYTVRARGSTDTVFPKMYVSFQQRECHLASPLSGVLGDGESVDVQLRVPGAEDVIVGVSGLARHLARAGDGVFVGEVVVERGQAGVFARFPGSTRYEGLLRYEVR
jgi:transglutaminase/protease-like cytokinesis protein 3